MSKCSFLYYIAKCSINMPMLPQFTVSRVIINYIHEKGTLTRVLWPRPPRSARGIFAIEAEISDIAKRAVRLEIGIPEASRYRISTCYLLVFFHGISPVEIAATCVTKTNNTAISRPAG